MGVHIETLAYTLNGILEQLAEGTVAIEIGTGVSGAKRISLVPIKRS